MLDVYQGFKLFYLKFFSLKKYNLFLSICVVAAINQGHSTQTVKKKQTYRYKCFKFSFYGYSGYLNELISFQGK